MGGAAGLEASSINTACFIDHSRVFYFLSNLYVLLCLFQKFLFYFLVLSGNIALFILYRFFCSIFVVYFFGFAELASCSKKRCFFCKEISLLNSV